VGFGAVAVEVTERMEALQALDEQGVRIYEEVVQAIAAAKLASEVGEDRSAVEEKLGEALTNAKTIIAGQLAHQFEDETSRIAARIPPPDPPARAVQGPRRVVVCDDDDTIRRILHLAVDADEAFEVVGEAANGAQCIDLVAETKPDLVVLDLNMPVMGGLDALPAIRKTSENTAVVVMSAFDAALGEPEAVARGASGYVEKGTNVFAVISKLKEVIQ
jgi:CheY-like chemotaxis protein